MPQLPPPPWQNKQRKSKKKYSKENSVKPKTKRGCREGVRPVCRPRRAGLPPGARLERFRANYYYYNYYYYYYYYYYYHYYYYYYI